MKEHFCPAEKTTITYQGKCNWCGESEGSMNEIIEMAKQVGMDYIEYISEDSMKQVKAFANLVAAKEREAFAKICDEFCYGSTKVLVERAIRARGEQS